MSPDEPGASTPTQGDVADPHVSSWPLSTTACPRTGVGRLRPRLVSMPIRRHAGIAERNHRRAGIDQKTHRRAVDRALRQKWPPMIGGQDPILPEPSAAGAPNRMLADAQAAASCHRSDPSLAPWMQHLDAVDRL